MGEGTGSSTATNFNRAFGDEESGEGIVDLKSSTPGSPTNPAELQDFIQQFATNLLSQTDPIRQGLIDDSTAFLESDRNVTGTQQFQGLKAAAGQQFGNAQQNILESTASGGALTEALATNQQAQAQALTQGAGILSEQELGRAQDIGFGGAQLGSDILGQLQQVQAGARQSERNQVVQGKKGSGGSAGAVSSVAG